jgi:hypothetical protein
MELVGHCGGEFSNGRVVITSLIAAASSRPNEQLMNRVTHGQKDIDSRYLPFLIVFTTRAVGLSGKLTKVRWPILSRLCDEDQ